MIPSTNKKTLGKKQVQSKPKPKPKPAQATVVKPHSTTAEPIPIPLIYYAYMGRGYSNDPQIGVRQWIEDMKKGPISTPVYAKVDYSKITNKNQIIDTAINQILGAETDPNKKKQLQTLLRMTNYMENRYGENDDAWKNKNVNYGFTELDKISIDNLFKPKGNKGTYTKGQKNAFEYLKNFGLPTNQKELEKLLLNNDPLANMAVSRLVYATNPNPLPDMNDQKAVFNYWLNDYNHRGAIKHHSEAELFKIFQQGYNKYNSPNYKSNIYVAPDGHSSIIDDNRGQWDHPGEVTRIASNNITMGPDPETGKPITYPVLGVGADGEQRMMYPNEEHTFNQGPVTEYPMMQAKDGGWLSKYNRGGVTWLNEYAQGGETFTAGGEKHRVYEKESPTGNGKGVQGHIMVTHPTTDKGKWDTIDLTKIAGAKTVAQGVAATKKWHAENPEYKDGGLLTQYQRAGQVMPADVLMDPKKMAQWMKDHPEATVANAGKQVLKDPRIVNIDPRLIKYNPPPRAQETIDFSSSDPRSQSYVGAPATTLLMNPNQIQGEGARIIEVGNNLPILAGIAGNGGYPLIMAAEPFVEPIEGAATIYFAYEGAKAAAKAYNDFRNYDFDEGLIHSGEAALGILPAINEVSNLVKEASPLIKNATLRAVNGLANKPASNINLKLSEFGENKVMPEIKLRPHEIDAITTRADLARANRDAEIFSLSPTNKAKLQEFRPGQNFSVSNQKARFIDDPEALKLYESYRSKNDPNIEGWLGNNQGMYGARDYRDMEDVVVVNKLKTHTSNIPSKSAYTDAMHETTHSRSIRLQATEEEKKIASDAWSPMIKNNDFGMPEEEAFAVQNELRTDKLKDITGDRIYTEKDIPEIKKGLQEMINEGHTYLRGVNVEDFDMPALIKSLNKIGLGSVLVGAVSVPTILQNYQGLQKHKNGGLTEYQTAGKVKPIAVPPGDPRYLAYQDSLNLYNRYQYNLDNLKSGYVADDGFVTHSGKLHSSPQEVSRDKFNEIRNWQNQQTAYIVDKNKLNNYIKTAKPTAGDELINKKNDFLVPFTRPKEELQEDDYTHPVTTNKHFEHPNIDLSYNGNQVLYEKGIKLPDGRIKYPYKFDNGADHGEFHLIYNPLTGVKTVYNSHGPIRSMSEIDGTGIKPYKTHYYASLEPNKDRYTFPYLYNVSQNGKVIKKEKKEIIYDDLEPVWEHGIIQEFKEPYQPYITSETAIVENPIVSSKKETAPTPAETKKTPEPQKKPTFPPGATIVPDNSLTGDWSAETRKQKGLRSLKEKYKNADGVLKTRQTIYDSNGNVLETREELPGNFKRGGTTWLNEYKKAGTVKKQYFSELNPGEKMYSNFDWNASNTPANFSDIQALELARQNGNPNQFNFGARTDVGTNRAMMNITAPYNGRYDPHNHLFLTASPGFEQGLSRQPYTEIDPRGVKVVKMGNWKPYTRPAMEMGMAFTKKYDPYEDSGSAFTTKNSTYGAGIGYYGNLLGPYVNVNPNITYRVRPKSWQPSMFTKTGIRPLDRYEAKVGPFKPVGVDLYGDLDIRHTIPMVADSNTVTYDTDTAANMWNTGAEHAGINVGGKLLTASGINPYVKFGVSYNPNGRQHFFPTANIGVNTTITNTGNKNRFLKKRK